jgi:hypothetical protein
MPTQIFLLSPAYCGGRRAAILLRPDSEALMASRLREGSLTLGDAFAFMSGLYFRGKLAYATAFGRASRGVPGALVITPTRGLQPPDLPMTAAMIREFAEVDIAAGDPRYHEPLERDLTTLAGRLPRNARAVLLGSVATSKYVDQLSRILGPRLHFPPSFIGRGDMSRGGLLLRSARAAVELDYATLHPSLERRGARPPRLTPLASRAEFTNSRDHRADRSRREGP